MIEHIVLNWRMGIKKEEKRMGKYDEFNLDIKQDKNVDIINPNACTVADAWSCVTISIDVCTIVSRALDCFSENSDCSGEISECSPCGSGYRGIARC